MTFEELLAIVEGQPLSRSLPAALTVATAIGDAELASWIRLEILGYLRENPAMTESTIVPEYRGVPGQWEDEYGRRLVVQDARLQFVNEIRLRHGVAELEGVAAASDDTVVMRPAEFAELIRTQMGVDVNVFRFRPTSVHQVLTSIKVHLLDRLAGRRSAINGVGETSPPAPNASEILQLKPTIYGVGVDLRALWRRLFSGR